MKIIDGVRLENHSDRPIPTNDRGRRNDDIDDQQALSLSVLDHLLEGCQLIAPDYRYLYVNDAVVRHGKAAREELLGSTMMEVYPGIDQTEMFSTLRRCMEDRTPAVMENEFEYPDGTTGWFELRFEPVPAGVVILSMDITDRKRSARRVAESQERTRAIYDHLPNALLVFRRRNDGFELFDFNEAARAATNGAIAELVGAPAEGFGGIPHLKACLRHCSADSAAIHREFECVLPGATEARQMALTYGFIPPDMVLLHAEDVTEQHRTKAQLAAARRLEAVGRLAGGIAHDFNNMLSVILMFASFSRDQLAESDPIRADLEQILEAGERAADLTKQLLAFSRKQVLEPRVTNLSDVVGGIEDMLRRLLGEDIDVELHHADDLGNVVADPGQIEQVMVNLAINARDAMAHGGKLTIELANAELDEEYARAHLDVEPGRYVRLVVTDTGEGMAPETANRVFEPFFTTKEESGGTGLGLSTAYGIVKQSGGDIWVYSEPGEGTSFKIYLPMVDAPTVERERAEPPVAPTGTETILLVEDNEGVRLAATRILASAGYRVLTAANGREALRLRTEHPDEIDLLLTDVIMPEMSGRELADQLKSEDPNLTVVFTSGYTGNAIAHHTVLGEGIRFIGKPFSAAELTRKVREALDET